MLPITKTIVEARSDTEFSLRHFNIYVQQLVTHLKKPHHFRELMSCGFCPVARQFMGSARQREIYETIGSVESIESIYHAPGAVGHAEKEEACAS